MIEALRRIPKHQYIIFTPVGNHSYDDLGLPVHRLPSLGRTIMDYMHSRMGSLGSGLFFEVDMVVSPIYTTRLLASRRPFVFTLHDLQEKYYPEYFNVAQRVWRDLANKSLTSAAALVICESNHVKSDIHKFLAVDNSRIEVIPAPPVSMFSPEYMESPEFDRAVNNTKLPEQFIFYPAQFFPHKNHIRLIEALALLRRTYPNCHLLLTGQQKYEFPKVMARVNELGLQDRVRHLGYVETGTLASLYRQSTLVVIPTLFESISIPVYEAFRLGAPVCASNVVALPEQIGDAGMLFDPLSITDMAEKISSLLGDQELRRELARRGKERISGLTSESYSAQLDRVLDRLA